MSQVIKLRGHHLELLVEYTILRDRGVDHGTIKDRFASLIDVFRGKGFRRSETELHRRIYEDNGDLRVRIISFFDDICTFPCKTFIDGIKDERGWYDCIGPERGQYDCIGPDIAKHDLDEAAGYQIKGKFLYSGKELIDKLRSSSRFKKEEREISNIKNKIIK